MWWVEYKVVLYRDQRYGLPFTPCKDPIESNYRPAGNFYGPFHCRECALTCVSFGKTRMQSFEFEHGTDDEKFGVFLGGG